MTATQQRELAPWLEAHGVVAGHVFRLDLDTITNMMTVYEYEFGKDGQLHAIGLEPVKRPLYTIDIGLALLPWMVAEREPVVEPATRHDPKRGHRHA
jgi:hypothetical protein